MVTRFHQSESLQSFRDYLDSIRIYDRAFSEDEDQELDSPSYTIPSTVDRILNCAASPVKEVFAGQVLMESGGREGCVASLMTDDQPAAGFF